MKVSFMSFKSSPAVSLQVGNFVFDFGWFSGEEFYLLNLNVLNVLDRNSINFFTIQVAKFLVTFSRYKI